MANYASSLCNDCPYHNSKHLTKTKFYTYRQQPLSIELNNNSTTLLVLQAPGEDEWKNGLPLQPTIKRGGSAGVRVENSLNDDNKSRDFIDITNSVQCYPGKGKTRDLMPKKSAINKCYEWLKKDIQSKKYLKIIAFGKIAQQQVKRAIEELKLTEIIFRESKHPNGGCSKEYLKSLW